MSFPIVRPRRLRQNQALRNLAQENNLSVRNLIYPLFVVDGDEVSSEISSMPGCFRRSIDLLVQEAREAFAMGIRFVALFPSIEASLKTERAEEAYNPNGLIPRALRVLKRELPELNLISDVALDPYTSHGHDGLVDEEGNILNDQTVEVLAAMALCQAKAGADIVAPSDMMDGRVIAIRGTLDQHGYQNKLILAYSAKFASAFYGPFRDALGSNLKFGDKKTYQLNPANAREAEKEIMLDISEGADLVMVKPGLAYLDILYRATQLSQLPVVVYAVSGEYAMIEAAAEKGWLDKKKVVLETMLAFRRAGAHGIITYHAKEIAGWLSECSVT